MDTESLQDWRSSELDLCIISGYGYREDTVGIGDIGFISIIDVQK